MKQTRAVRQTKIADRTAVVLSSAFLTIPFLLHLLEPEFDPSWRMIREYELGRYGWLMSLAFSCWGGSVFALLIALWPSLRTMGDNLVSGAQQDIARRIAFLEQHGFRCSGEFAEVNMLRSLDGPLQQPVLPAGCHVRAVAETGEISNRVAAPSAAGRRSKRSATRRATQKTSGDE